MREAKLFDQRPLIEALVMKFAIGFKTPADLAVLDVIRLVVCLD